MEEEIDPINEYIKSEQFRKDFAEQVKKDTWGNGLPMVYLDKNRNIVEHWEDGTINILHTEEEWKLLDKLRNENKDV